MTAHLSTPVFLMLFMIYNFLITLLDRAVIKIVRMVLTYNNVNAFAMNVKYKNRKIVEYIYTFLYIFTKKG